ncbi:hypothetical protein HPB52_005919 [Rhipicephalus sanguineus]|uniref:Uncharacterized protein n=1 Tax=Rhipicephalus sanguineus TaxID=34632 RepID=A0A9D4PL73_RHISA|nr:hypothetical protein HPB52_005919 [Rhipicephalus sanguineus]
MLPLYTNDSVISARVNSKLVGCVGAGSSFSVSESSESSLEVFVSVGEAVKGYLGWNQHAASAQIVEGNVHGWQFVIVSLRGGFVRFEGADEDKGAVGAIAALSGSLSAAGGKVMLMAAAGQPDSAGGGVTYTTLPSSALVQAAAQPTAVDTVLDESDLQGVPMETDADSTTDPAAMQSAQALLDTMVPVKITAEENCDSPEQPRCASPEPPCRLSPVLHNKSLLRPVPMRMGVCVVACSDQGEGGEGENGQPPGDDSAPVDSGGGGGGEGEEPPGQGDDAQEPPAPPPPADSSGGGDEPPEEQGSGTPDATPADVPEQEEEEKPEGEGEEEPAAGGLSLETPGALPPDQMCVDDPPPQQPAAPAEQAADGGKLAFS